MSALLHRLGRFSARHRKTVLGVWVLILAVTVVAAGLLGSKSSVDIGLPNTGSQDASDLLDADFPSQANSPSPIVMKSPGAPLTDTKYADAIGTATKNLQDDDLVSQVVSPLTQAGASQLSENQEIGYLSVTLKENLGQVTKSDAEDVANAAIDPLKAAGLEAVPGGSLGSIVDQEQSDDSEGLGLLAAVLILLFTFGSAVAMGLPIMTAIFGLATALSLITVLSNVMGIPDTGPVLATMIGLGVGIDYALFIVTRYREELASGHEPQAAVERSIATSGAAVVFAGTTVIIALLALAVARIPIVTAMGITSALAVLIAMIAAITLLPAVLAMLGTRVNALRLPWRRHQTHEAHATRWERFAHEVALRPKAFVGVSLVILLTLAFPVTQLTLGQPDTDALPADDEQRIAYDLLADGFGPGVNGPLLVAVKLGSGSKGDTALTNLSAALPKADGVAAVSPPQKNSEGTVAIYSVVPTTGPSAEGTSDLVTELRDETIPPAVAGTDSTAYVGGLTAGYVDLADRIAASLPWLIAVVLALSFLLLLLAFRSVALPAQAAVMNLLSVGAAYGILTFVFQDGHGAGLLGLPGPVPVVSYVPLMMFAILFGLSMDYEVFLLSRIRERYDAGANTHDAVVGGLAASAKVITAAASIMVVVFGAFLLNDDPTIKQFGLGMAVAVLIDATIVRCLLVPSLMVLLGKANWWLPGWLDRILPPLGLDETLDAAPPAGAPAPESSPA